MAYPTKPTTTTSYTAVEQALGDGSLPGQELDVDFANLRASVDETIDFVRGFTRSDGRLGNGTVSRDTLAPDITLGVAPPEPWETGREYSPPETVFEANKFYICERAHTSDVFANDLASGRWTLLADFTAISTEFRTIYLGAAASDPTTDLNGDPLIAGALYYNTTLRRLRVYQSGEWVDATQVALRQQAVYTALAGQTTFAINYTLGVVDVWLNGVKLTGGTDYTAATGTNIVLSTPTADGDVVEAIGYIAFEIVDAVPEAPNDGRSYVRRGNTWVAGEDVDDIGGLPDAGTLVTDWDQATTLGFYYSGPGAANAPTTGRVSGIVTDGGGGALVQIVWRAEQDSTWFRARDTGPGAWRPWRQVLADGIDTVLTAGYAVTSINDGTKSSGTYTPSRLGSNIRRIVNGGAFTLAAPTDSGDYTMIVQITNGGAPGEITFSGFTAAIATDALTTAGGDVFRVYITKIGTTVTATVEAVVATSGARTWQDVSGQRTAGVWYTNTTGRDIQVSAYSAANGSQFLVSSDGGATSLVLANVPGGSEDILVNATVPAGTSYLFSGIWSQIRELR